GAGDDLIHPPRGARRRPLCAWDIPDDLSKPAFLAIAQRGIGDALTLLPSLRALRAARADVRIELVAPGLLALAENVRDTATIVAIQPGAGDPSRVWPADKFRARARALAQTPRITVLVFLGDSDTPFNAPGYLPGQANLRSVREPLESAVSKLAACALFVGND